MKIEVANAEIADKVSILRIKRARLSGAAQRANVDRELAELLPALALILPEDDPLVADLHAVNDRLWDAVAKVNDGIHRDRLDDEFVEAARTVTLLNIERARIKRRINEATASAIVEEKDFSLDR